jgi:hypothetical protein
MPYGQEPLVRPRQRANVDDTSLTYIPPLLRPTAPACFATLPFDPFSAPLQREGGKEKEFHCCLSILMSETYRVLTRFSKMHSARKRKLQNKNRNVKPGLSAALASWAVPKLQRTNPLLSN